MNMNEEYAGMTRLWGLNGLRSIIASSLKKIKVGAMGFYQLAMLKFFKKKGSTPLSENYSKGE